MAEKLMQVPVDALTPDPNQPRQTFRKDEIERLAASISARGMLLPLRVLFDVERNSYRIITGECRWRAAKLAGLATVPCLTVEGELPESDILSEQIIENSVRHSLLPMELARSLAKLKALKGCTSRQLSEELGISGGSLSRAEALLSLPEEIQAMVDDGRVPESAAYEISRLPDEASQFELAQSVASGRMTRDQVADTVRSRIGRKKVTPKASRLACRFDSGLSITVSAGQPLTWEDLMAALDQIRREAKKLCDGGKEISALAKSLKAS